MMLRALIAVVLFLVQRQAFQQRDDPEEGKPPSCDNFHATLATHKCACGKAMHGDCSQHDPDVEMDKRCKTYCRKQNCKCISRCAT